MNTIDLEEVKNAVAVKNGFVDWHAVMFYHNSGMVISSEQLSEMINEVAEEYAKQCCDEQIKACAEKAKIQYTNADNIEHIEKGLYTSAKTLVEVNKESILSTPNVVTTKP